MEMLRVLCLKLIYSDVNITVSTTLKYYYKQALNKNLNLMGRSMKYLLEKPLDHEIFSSMVPWATNLFLQNL